MKGRSSFVVRRSSSIFHGVLDHVDAQQLAARRQLDGDDVNPPLAILLRMLVEIGLRDLEQLRSFDWRDRFFGRAEAVAAPGADFDEDPRAGFLGHDVELADRAAPVALDDTIAAPLQLA